MNISPKIKELINELILVAGAAGVGALTETLTNQQGQTLTWGIIVTAVGYRVLIAVVFKLNDWLTKNQATTIPPATEVPPATETSAPVETKPGA